MGLDIRVPIGLMFGVLGVMLGVFGLVSDKAIYERSLGININIWWGVILLVFGGAMYFFGRRANLNAKPTDANPKANENRGSRPRGH
jgi:protein-S-isoprenylcysteine O-methyltransferase Ste14